MFTVELGQAWKRRGAGGTPHDSVALEFDGINVLPPVAEESLPRVVGELVHALASLAIDDERSGQVSLEESNLELCFWRTTGFEVELQVIDFGQPPRRVGPVYTLELDELKEAICTCARGFMRDAGHLPELDRQVRTIEATLLEELPVVAAASGGPLSVSYGDGHLHFTACDAVGRAGSWSKKSRAALPALLIEGRLEAGEAKVEGLIFLELQRMARAAAADGHALVGKQRVDAHRVFEAGLELAVALRRHHPALAQNPYVESLQVRCTDGLAALKQPVPDSTPTPLPFTDGKRTGSAAPLIRQGAARRVRLQEKWSAPVTLGEESGRLLLGSGGLVIASARAAQAFTTTGKSRYRRLASRGAAASPGASGNVIFSDPSSVMLFAKRKNAAAWSRDFDGSQIGPELFETNGIGVASLGGRGALAFDLMTGRELWRFEPARTQRGFLSVQGHRVLLATDGGSVFGLDAHDGQIRFRIRAPAPAVGPAISFGRRAMFVLTQADQTTVVFFEALGADGAPAGGVLWSSDLALTHPCAPVMARQRTFISGIREGKTHVLCLDPSGQQLWQRAIACDGRTTKLLAFESGVIASDARGVAVRVLPDGQIDWVLGASGDELSHPLGLVAVRKLLVVPGPVIRIVEPLTGRVLSELEAGPHLAGLALDSRFTLYIYVEPGTLQAYTPGTLLSVM